MLVHGVYERYRMVLDDFKNTNKEAHFVVKNLKSATNNWIWKSIVKYSFHDYKKLVTKI